MACLHCGGADAAQEAELPVCSPGPRRAQHPARCVCYRGFIVRISNPADPVKESARAAEKAELKATLVRKVGMCMRHGNINARQISQRATVSELRAKRILQFGCEMFLSGWNF